MQLKTCNSLIIATVLAAFAMTTSAEEFPVLETAFSADFHSRTGDLEAQGRIWVDGPMRRQEVDLGGNRHVVVIHADQGAMYVMEEGDPDVLRLDHDPETAGLPVAETFTGLDPVFEAHEKVSGEATLRFRVQGSGPLGHPTQGRLWVTPDGIVIRATQVATMDGERIESETRLENVSRGAQPPERFELPETTGVH